MSAASSIDGAGKGYVRLYRKLLESPLFLDKPAAWLKIWLFILLRANWRESVFRPRLGESITVPAGSMVTSLEKLGTHAALSKEHARRCLDYLERTHAVTLQRTHHWTMITVVNWTAYQQSDEATQHTEQHTEHHGLDENGTHETPHRTPRVATPSKELKKTTKEYMSNSGELDAPREPQPRRSRKQIDPEVLQWFEAEFWPAYPRHEGKQKALEAANANAATPEKRAFCLTRLKAQLPEYQRRKQESGQRVIPLASTWFNQDRAEDELELLPTRTRNNRPANLEDYPEYIPLERAVGQAQ